MVNLADRFYDKRGQVFDVNATVDVFFEVEFVLGVLAQKVPDLLVVDFEVGCTDKKLFAVRLDAEITSVVWGAATVRGYFDRGVVRGENGGTGNGGVEWVLEFGRKKKW